MHHCQAGPPLLLADDQAQGSKDVLLVPESRVELPSSGCLSTLLPSTESPRTAVSEHRFELENLDIP